MARDSFDESKNTKKKVTKKKTEEKKPQSSSVTKPKTTTTKADKVASKSTFLGGGAPVQKVEQAASKPTTVKKPANTKKQTVTKQDQINQKMYGTTKPNVTTKTQRTKRDTKPVTSKTQRQINAEANMNLKQRNIRDTAPVQSRRTATTTAAQRQKMGMPTQQDLQDARASRRELANSVRSSVREATSEENKGFMQRQKSGTLTASDKQRIEKTNQRRAEVARNTRDVAKKAVIDTGSGYAQSIYDLTELTAGNKNGTQTKAMKMGLDPNRDRSQIAKLEREQKYTAAESKRRRDELFQKQEQRQAEWDERTKNAKGIEKAWYGAVESGTGMVADTLVGAATGTGQFGALASMGLRTYGPSANQARKEGATDTEARLYGLAQSAKEVGTELMFQGAGLAKAAYGKTGLSLADKSANILTRGLTGLKADAVGAGVRALGGTAEENIEELAGWMADPLIKELTYGKAVRNRMKENLRANIPQIGSDADAAHVASYFSTPKFTDDLTNEYVKSGMSRDKASSLAAEMRDYYVAYYSGDKGRLDALEEDLAAKLSGQDKLSFRSWSMDELKDTFASTTLLTLATGLPGAVTTSVKGNQIFDSDEVKAVFGNDAVRKVADAVKNTSNREMSLKAETMEDRLNSGKDLTGTQKYDLYQGYIEKVNETAKKARASNGVVENARQEQNLVPTMGVDRAGNTVYAKETQREYDEKYAETAVTAESLRRFMESDNSISDDEIRRTDAAIKAVSDLHVGGLTIGDAHEFAYGNNLARETLKIEEGIDLDRYIVRKADGTVDLAATNEATENALFRINAENAIKAAQAETEVYIDDTRGNIDKDLLTRFGNSGQAAWKEVNKDLDPRDLKNYLTTANAASYFYSAGRNTDMSVDEAINRYADTFKTVDNSVLEKAFTAGAEDRIIANTPGYGQTVEAGSNIQFKKTEPIVTGQLIMDDDVVLPDSDQSAYLALAMSTNTNIHIVSNLNAMGKDGKPIINQATGLPVQLNGMSHGNDIYLSMNEASEKNLGYVFMHEMTHQIKQYAPNEYLALENLVRDKWFNKDATGMQAAIKQRMDLYSVKGGQQLTEEEAVEEIIADAMAEAMDDPNFAAEVCEQDINLGEKILESIRGALRSIRQIFANSDYKNDRFHNSLLSYLGILDEAEKMWLNALHTARQNKADGLIADWQDKANKQNAPRLSVTEVSDEEHEGRYSITLQKDADINELDKTNSIVEDDNGDPVAQFEDNGSVSFSISSYESEGRKIYKDYLDKLVKNDELSQKEADDMLHELETIYDISKRFADQKDENGNPVFAPYTAWSYADVVRDEKGKPVFSAIKKNSEYKMNIDFSTICKKRRTLDAVFREMIKRGLFEQLDLNKDESAALVVNINNLIRKNQFEAACALCFVEARRYRQQQTAKTFTNMWNNLVESMYKDKSKIAYFNFGRDEQAKDVPDGIHTLDDSQLDLSYITKIANEKKNGKPVQTAEAKAARLILNDPNQRKLMRVGDMMASTGFENMQIENPELMKVYNSKKGTGGAKSSFGDVQYLNEMIRSKTFDRQKAYDVSGVRIQSFSDYVPRMVFDYVQVIADLAAKKLPAHAYTKEPLFVKQFGLSGVKINLSLVPDVVPDGIAPGLDANGDYIWNVEGTFPYDEAMKIQEAEGYKENCGTIAVGISNEQIMKMLADPTIQMVIPYHKSSLNPIVAAMTNVDRFTNYEDFQNTKNEEGKAVKTDFAWDKKLFGLTHYTRGEKKGELKPREQWGNVQDLVKEYVEWCEKKNYTPKFSQFLYQRVDNKFDGDFVLDENGNKVINPGYYKLLEDFALLDNEGNFKPQGDVQMRFPTAESAFDSMEELIKQGLSEDTQLEADRSAKIGGIVDEIENMMAEGTLTEQSVTSQKLAQKFSISPEMDDAYMDAVNSGNMDEAQRLVDEAAKMAMPNTKLKGRWYHGTENEFTEFNFSQGGKNGTADGFGIYLTNDPEVASSYGNRMIEGYVNVERPASALTTATLTKPELHRLIRRTVDIEAETLQYDGYDSLEDAKKDTWISNYVDTYSAKNLEDAIADVTDSILQLNGNDMDIVQEIMTGMGIRDYDSAMDFYDMLTEETGIDGFETKWGDESEMADPNTPTIALAFRSNQIKSADTVTYAEDGSVIPLSERFDPDNDDIRYSLPTQDSDGKILADGQMEFFKNSQARDEQGRLVPVYHATDEGGFTIFDPWKSDDHRSLFFSSRRDVAKTYAYNGGNAFDFAPKKLNSWNDLIQYGRQLFSDADMSWDNDTDDANLDFELHDKQTGDWADIDYDEWLDLANSNDPHADDYRVRISLPYNNKDGETETVSFEGDSMSDLLNNVANGNIPHGGHYQVYLNLENPLIIEGHGQPWNDIVAGGATFPSYSYVTLKKASWFREEAERRDEMYGLGQSLYNGDKDRARADEFESDDFVEIEIFDGQKKIKNIIPIDEEAIADELAAAFGIDDIEIVEGIANELAGDMSWQNFSKFYGDDMRNTIGEYGYDTREWAEFAEDEGHDGVIFRNIIDIDDKTEMFDSEEEAASDVYVAFSSNQVKDVNNENPTENPDIRFSITPEDEAKSKIAYDDAMSDSYNALQEYEASVVYGSESEYFKGKAYLAGVSEENISEFFDALKAEDAVPSTDSKFEEDRVRRAKSKEDFYNNVYAKWNDRWTTEGEVLDIKSVKTDITKLVKGVMANSDTDAKYRNEIVRQTLIDVRNAYQLMKQDRSDVASYLLYHSAQRMIDGVEFIRDDTAFKEYKEIRDYLRTYRINAPEEYWENEKFQDFRKEYYGRLRIGKGKNNIEDVYSDLESRWPYLFNESERKKADLGDSVEDLLLHIGVVVDSNVTPFMEAYSSEEAVALAYETADALYDIMAGGKGLESLADSYKNRFDEKTAEMQARHAKTVNDYKNRFDAKTKAMKARHAEAILRERRIREEGIQKEREKFRVYKEKQKERQADLIDKYEGKISDLKVKQGRKLKAQKAKADFEFATLKQNREYNIQRLKAEKARAVKEERQRGKWRVDEIRERLTHNKYFKSIQKTHKKLTDRLLSNTADSHIPEQYKRELARLLSVFDLQTMASKEREIRKGPNGYTRVDTSPNTLRMAAVKSVLEQIEKSSDMFRLNDAITDTMNELMKVDGLAIDAMNVSDLQKLDTLMKALLHEFNNYEKVRIGQKKQQVADLASAQTVSAIEHAKTFGPGNDYFGIKGWMDQIINMDEMTPAYMFKRIDPENVGLGLMWKEIKRSQDRYIRNTAQIQKWVEEIIGDYHNKGRFNKKYGSETIEKWRSSNYQQTYNLTNGTVQLTPAQAMSLYCLSKRNQAYGHMVGAGVVVAPVSFQAKIMSDLKRKTNRALPVILTDADIKTVVQSLTPEQIQVANQLQELMSTKMADLGNEASMNVLGIKLFNEQDYFPIKSDKAALERDLSNEEFENAIRNFGFTKAVQPGARNAIMIEDIFDVLTEHCNNMNLYNSYSETLNDFMKVFNKHTIMEDGSDYSVRQAVAHAYSQKATTFIMEFIRDLNGNVSKGRATGLDNAMSDMLGRAKQASVFANIRVLLQQPTAITRAFAVIDPKYLKGVSLADVAKGSIPTVTTEAMQEMFDHCPIALWKSWGYYDINMGRSIESVIMNEGNFLEDLATSAYGKADNITWTAIWQMVKEETKDKNPELKEGTDEFWEHCNERMSEIVDFTQVVDSPLHRSHLMRSKQLHHKIFSAFMAEPTLTFNMIRDGYASAKEEWMKGNKTKAAKTMGRIAAVASLQAATVAAAAAIADAIRGKNKGGGDDDDDSFGALWYKNFLENLKDEAKIWNKVYYIKDLASIAEGWDNANLALQGWKTLTDGFRQFDKKMFEGSKTPWWNIYYNLLGGIGYFTGVPVKTLMKDGRAIFELLGGQLPESLVGEEKSESVISSDSKLQSLRLLKGQKDTDKKTITSAVRVNMEDKWYDYENNPITVKDGSALDKILNHFGINLTASEKAQIAASQAQQERDSKAEEISNKYADLSGEERDKKVWSSVTTYYKNQGEDSKVFADMVANGDYGDINEMKSFYLKAGGNAEYFDKRVLAESKKALKKSIKYGQTNQEIDAQERVKNYMLSHGMTEQEVSEIVYKSDTAKDMKVAFRLNDKDLMMETLEPLVNAGLTYEDLERLWENRNRMQLSSYNGRYKDKLKSTGKYIWPTDGVITSHFGYRNAPTAGASSNHPAIDIGAPQGTAVVAADGGVVISAGANGGYGNSVGIKHDNGMITWYNHLYDWNVKVGDTVAQGQQIAQVGSTGISTGPHLDFKIMDTDGNPVDPEKYLEAR